MLEILIVVVIISILSVTAITQYTKTIERQHGRNAISYLKAIRSAQLRYYLEHDGEEGFTSNIEELDIAETIIELGEYFTFQTSSSGGNGFTVTAVREGSPAITIDQDNKIVDIDEIYQGIY